MVYAGAMTLRLPRVLARHPLFVAATVFALGTFALTSGVRAVFVQNAAVVADDLSDDSGRSILNRFWMDQWPDSPTTKAHYLLFMAGGLGLHEEGAAYKFSIEFFEFERFGKRLETKFLDSGEKKEVKFKVERCDELPPFDACLRIEDPFRGPKTYYSFARDGELAERLPWLQGELDLAKARAEHH